MSRVIESLSTLTEAHPLGDNQRLHEGRRLARCVYSREEAATVEVNEDVALVCANRCAAHVRDITPPYLIRRRHGQARDGIRSSRTPFPNFEGFREKVRHSAQVT